MSINGFMVVVDQQNQLVQSESQLDFSRGLFMGSYPLSNRPFAANPDSTLGQGNVFEIDDFSYDTHIGTATGTTSSSKVAFEFLSVSMKVDKATPLFFQDLAASQKFNYVDIVLEKAAGGTDAAQAYCVLGFGTVLEHSFALAYDDESPRLTLAFAYRQAQIAYRQQKPDGSYYPWIVKGWDRETNTAI